VISLLELAQCCLWVRAPSAATLEVAGNA